MVQVQKRLKCQGLATDFGAGFAQRRSRHCSAFLPIKTASLHGVKNRKTGVNPSSGLTPVRVLLRHVVERVTSLILEPDIKRPAVSVSGRA